MLCTAFGEVFASIGVKEPQKSASEAFTEFGDAHRTMEKYGIKLLKTAKPVSICLYIKLINSSVKLSITCSRI